MVDVIYTDKFEKEFKKADSTVKQKALKRVHKIIQNPEIGKPLRYDLKGERIIYIKPFYQNALGLLIFGLKCYNKNSIDRKA